MDSEMGKCPCIFLMTESPWDPLVLDNKFEEEFYDTITELPEVKERRDGADPCVDDYGFLQTCQDYKYFSVHKMNSLRLMPILQLKQLEMFLMTCPPVESCVTMIQVW